MPLSREEITALVNKLRDKYDEYSYKHSPRYFDRVAFEDRYNTAIVKKMNMESFALAEITNFEKLKAKYAESKDKGSISRKIDNMIEENLKAVRKYPPIEFHSKAGIELPHFIGALNMLAESYLPSFWLILDDPQMRSNLNLLEQLLSDFAVMRGSLPPKKCEDLILYFRRSDLCDVDIEKARNNFMKEASFILHDIARFCGDILETKSSLLDNPVKFDKLFQSDGRKKRIAELFNGHTGYGCALKTKDFTEGIITDFRLGAFKRSSANWD